MADPQAVRAVLADLRVEGEELDALVAAAPPERWRAATPAAGWTVAHQIAHLAWTDGMAEQAVADPSSFATVAALDPREMSRHVDEAAARGADQEPGALLARWRESRARMLTALEASPPGARHPWYGPPMSTASMASARLMETWAHGEDIAAALGADRVPTARLRHVARLAHATRDYAFAVRGRPVPPEPFRLELTAPDGSLWTYGPAGAPQRVTGPALDFCLLSVRRRHRDDLALQAVGEDADAWLSIAQVFAGAPGRDPEAGRAR
ncbi:TIGR03084 family metal-binding protein [Actinacidiphila guanduensis]|uniref:TIGR03084 family protein n=1 Tax=Actinacidiphila guanduensis TaxID=310781 RepID=A0A1H0RH06_9ACTN|nr:TIGR03084 family metal-binding protein [Actinacidiphila guanduensis]SDP28833.1 TIGR03084 family protein [Actinacidiphila guanduensis]